MKTQQELTDKCTPEIIKKMCELAEGFEFSDNMFFSFLQIKYNGINLQYQDVLMFPLLIHRSVEGWNNIQHGEDCVVVSDDNLVFWSGDLDLCKAYDFKNYYPTTLTHAECAMLDCLLEVLK